MKTIKCKALWLLIFCLTLFVFLSACHDDLADIDNHKVNTGEQVGSVMFWIDPSFTHGLVTITCNTVSRPIRAYVRDGVPQCGAPEGAPFSMTEGVYPYTASCSDGTVLSGRVSIDGGQCKRVQLTNIGMVN